MGKARGQKPSSRIRTEQQKEKKEKRVMNGGQNSSDLREQTRLDKLAIANHYALTDVALTIQLQMRIGVSLASRNCFGYQRAFIWRSKSELVANSKIRN